MVSTYHTCSFLYLASPCPNKSTGRTVSYLLSTAHPQRAFMIIPERFLRVALKILHKCTERVARLIQDGRSENMLSALWVTVRGEQYVIPTSLVSAIYDNVPIVPVPNVPKFVAGIVNPREHRLVMLDLAVLLGVSGDASGINVPVAVNHKDRALPSCRRSRQYLVGRLYDATVLLHLASMLDDTLPMLNTTVD